MRVVISAQGPDLNSPADPRFGRARYLLLIDTDSGEYSPFDNNINLNAAQGAGIQTARKAVELKAEAVVTGHVGPKAFATLNAGQVAVYTGASGKVSDVLEQFKAGRLQWAESADVEGHWV